ncbi:cellulose binding domain-containing protein (plasmid) [Spirosoma sp. SC4-14]|uniref:cellulose binding domain-containing protein n=1 Tax=Spirosoma sp. SC4-14 TaxID=3128900 RepID=UPI0030CC9EB3
MRHLPLLILLCLLRPAVAQTNFVTNGGFESYPVGAASFTTTTAGTLGAVQAGKWQLTFVTGSCTGGCSGGTAQIDNTTKNSGSNSLYINIAKQTNRNDIKLFQVFPATPTIVADRYELSFFMKADAANYLFTVDVLKSTQSTTTNGAPPFATLFRSTTGWKQYKMVVDLTGWTDAERTNMRISIRPNTNTTTALPTGPFPKVFWIDDVVFKPYTTRGDLAGLKDIAIQVAQERQQMAADSGFADEATALASEIVQLQNSSPAAPVVPDKAIGFNPAIQVTTNNPFIQSLSNWASGYLSQAPVVYPKSKPGVFVFPGSSFATCRTLGVTLEQLHWLLVSPLSDYQYNGELFRRFLQIVYATSDDYKLNGGGEVGEIPGSTDNGMNDWFATGPITYGWRMADLSFSGYIPPTLDQRLKDAAYQAGTNYRAIEPAFNQGTYTNRDISYAETLMHAGLFLNNPDWINFAKTIINSVTNQASGTGQYPDGAFSYIRTQNEVANYHGATYNSLAKLWAVSDYQPAWDGLSRGANYEVLSIEAQDVQEFYTAPAWKTQWNGALGASGEPLLYVTENPYLKTKFDQLKAIYGYTASPLYASFYKANLTGKPLPDNYVVYDRNIQGPRGRYGRYSYGITARSVSPAGDPEPGLQTFVGAMTTQTGRSANHDEMNAALMAVHSKVHVRTNTGTQWQDWAYMATNIKPKVCVAKTASSVSSTSDLQYQTSGPTGRKVPWSSYQQWITLPDRMIGLVETYPTNNTDAQALEIDGRVRFTYGRTGLLNPKNLVVDEAGKRYTYGTLKAIIHEHDFSTVTTGIAGVLRDDVQQAEEIIFRYNLSDGTNLYTYPGSTKKYFIIEIRNADAVGDAVVSRITDGSVKGLVVKLNGKSFSSFRNNGPTDATVDISAGLVAGNTNEVHFSRADAPTQLAQVLSTTAVSLAANEQILTVSSNDEADLGNGWQNFDQTLSGIPTNTTPIASATIASQTATVGQSFSLTTPAFTDVETPGRLTVAAADLPDGLSFANGILSGTPTAPGTSTITLTATDPNGLTGDTRFTLTVSLPVTLKIQYKDGDNGQLTNNQISPRLQLTNVGNAPVPYSEVTIRYWFTAENYAPINTWLDYAQLGNDNVKMAYVWLDQPRAGATGYVEYSFLPSAGNLAAGSNSGEIQTRISKQNWTNFDESDDYSYAANAGYALTDKITIYRTTAGGAPQLIWGTEPPLVPQVLQVKAQSENRNSNTGTNTISTYLKIANTGNTPIAYKDLTVRYWFTADGTQPLNYWIDYAELGSGKVSGRFVKTPTLMTGTDTYFEMKFDSTLGSLYPQSNTGNIQYRIAKNDWSNFDETNDYSYKVAAPMADNDHITLYKKASDGSLQLLYGTEPASGARRAAQESTELVIGAYPNPVENQVTIRAGESAGPIDVTIYGTTGRIVHQEHTQFGTPFTVGHLATGIYLLKVQTDQQVRYCRLLKK